MKKQLIIQFNLCLSISYKISAIIQYYKNNNQKAQENQPMKVKKPDYSYLSKLQSIDQFNCGNQYTTIQLLHDTIHTNKKFIKKTILLKPQNQCYAMMEKTTMQMIDSEFVVKLLHTEIVQKELQHKLVRKLILYMEFFQNGDLQEYLIKQKPTLQERFQIFFQILLGLKSLHEYYIIHRDLKLKNIFVSKHKKIKIGDLGIASQTLNFLQTNVGTFGQQAPQVYTNTIEGYNQKADVWSLGYVAFQILNIPYQNQSKIRQPFMPKLLFLKKLSQKPLNVDKNQFYLSLLNKSALIINQQIPLPAKTLIIRMLQIDPKQRISMKQIYTQGYFEKLKGFLKNSQCLERVIKLKTQYLIIQKRKKEIQQYEKQFDEIYQEIYPKISQCIANMQYTQSPQCQIKLIFFMYMVLNKLNKIYETIKKSNIMVIKKKWSKINKKICQDYLTYRNKVNHYLIQNKQPLIEENPAFNNDEIFQKLKKWFGKNYMDGQYNQYFGFSQLDFQDAFSDLSSMI